MPSMFITPREAKCRIDSFNRAGQLVLMQRLAASASSRTILPPHTGHALGMRNGVPVGPLRVHPHHFRDHVAAALDHHVVADLQPQPPISSSLCSVARETVTPPTSTGFRCATGVSAPVRPTCTSMSSTAVTACRAAYL